MKLTRFAALPALSLVCALAAPALAAPKDRAAAEAKALVASAHRARRGGRTADAIAALKKAEKLAPSPAIELELGEALAASGKLVDARRVLATAAGSTDTSRPAKKARAAAQKALAALEPRIPTVRLEVAGPPEREAAATIDGVDVVDVSREVRADPGAHTAGAAADGFVAVEKDVALTEGAHVVVRLELAPVHPPEPPPPPTRGGSRVPGVVALSLGGAGLAMGGVFGVLAFHATGTAKAQCTGGVCPPSAAGDVARSKLYGDVSTGAFIAGGALAAAGIVLVVLAPGAKKGEAESARIVPWLGAGQAGVAGTF